MVGTGNRRHQAFYDRAPVKTVPVWLIPEFPNKDRLYYDADMRKASFQLQFILIRTSLNK